MVGRTEKITWIAIVVSLVFHAGLYVVLRGSSSARVPTLGRRGVVAVDFVQTYSHRRGAKTKESAEDQVATSGHSASRSASEPASANAPVGPVGDPAVAERESNLFILAITTLIDRHKIYPPAAVEREEEGKVVLGISVERDGRIASVEIEEPCPFELLNQAALRTVNAIGHFPPVPEIVPVPLHLHVPLVFRVERP